MTHEFKKIIDNAILLKQKGLNTVLATVVALDGSSYRRPGVQMLIAQDGTMTGAVSGGCVEKEVLNQAQEVFNSNKSRVMTYDGRYRLGCEGILYILLEPFYISKQIEEKIAESFRQRDSFKLISYFRKEETLLGNMGSVVQFQDGTHFRFSDDFREEQEQGGLIFSQDMKPLFRLYIIGSEHDAVQLCLVASFLGWEVSVIASPKDPRIICDFPGASSLLNITSQEAEAIEMDAQTAVVLMNHNYATDLAYLMALKDKQPFYIGLLGSVKRREKLFNELIEFHPHMDDSFLEKIFGPAGINIGAETPQEIAVSVLAEILSVLRKVEVLPLRHMEGKIHK